MAKKSGSRREIDNIKKKAFKKRSYSIRNISSSDLDSDISISGDSEWEELRHPNEFKEIN